MPDIIQLELDNSYDDANLLQLYQHTLPQKGSSGTATSQTCEAKFPSPVSGKVQFSSEKFLAFVLMNCADTLLNSRVLPFKERVLIVRNTKDSGCSSV